MVSWNLFEEPSGPSDKSFTNWLSTMYKVKQVNSFRMELYIIFFYNLESIFIIYTVKVSFRLN